MIEKKEAGFSSRKVRNGYGADRLAAPRESFGGAIVAGSLSCRRVCVIFNVDVCLKLKGENTLIE